MKKKLPNFEENCSGVGVHSDCNIPEGGRGGVVTMIPTFRVRAVREYEL